MSRQLPPRPSFEYLRKQAKDLLREMQQQNPSTQLTDAQHALAKDYGFASWPKLKMHVESLTPIVATASGSSPFSGTWIADVLRSHRHPLRQFRSATLSFDVDGDLVTIADVVLNDSGVEERSTYTLCADDIEHPSEHGGGYAIRVSWRGSHALETIGTKDGEVIGRGRYEVSPDGKTLTVSSDEQLIVLARL